MTRAFLSKLYPSDLNKWIILISPIKLLICDDIYIITHIINLYYYYEYNFYFSNEMIRP